MAPLDDPNDCVVLEIPVTVVVTYDKTSPRRQRFAEHEVRHQVAGVMSTIQPALLEWADRRNEGDDEMIVGFNFGGGEQ